MIVIRAQLGEGRTVLDVRGHTDSTVCAVISAITQTCLLGLEAVAEQHPDLVRVDITEGTHP